MRVIAGQYRSRILNAPRGMDTRPTSDRLRETLFNVLAPRIEGVRFLDLYAGSGAVGIEALSRGAAEAVFVERSPAALAVLRANLEKLGIRGEAHVRAGTARGFFIGALGPSSSPRRSLEGADAEVPRHSPPGPDRLPGQFDVVFLDPPYDAAGDYESTLSILGGSNLPSRSQERGALRKHQSRPSTGSGHATGHPSFRLLAQDGVVVVEHRRKDRLEERYGDLARMRVLEQGDAALSFYQRISAI